ncbi:hypothetical protein ACG7TL_008357 [Trametes sanguinea]
MATLRAASSSPPLAFHLILPTLCNLSFAITTHFISRRRSSSQKMLTAPFFVLSAIGSALAVSVPTSRDIGKLVTRDQDFTDTDLFNSCPGGPGSDKLERADRCTLVNIANNPNVRKFEVLGDPQLNCGGGTDPVTVTLGGSTTITTSQTLDANIGVDVEGISIGGGASTTDSKATTVSQQVSYSIPPGRQAVYVAGTNQQSQTGNVQVNYGDRQDGHFIWFTNAKVTILTPIPSDVEFDVHESDCDAAAFPLPLAIAIADRSVTVRGSPSPKRPPSRAQQLSDKAQQRLMRQAVIQAELEAEEREALKMTPEELKTLQDSVASVKAEFLDLDGLSWDTPEGRELLAQWPPPNRSQHAEQAARQRATSPDGAGGVPLRHSKAPSALSFPESPVIDITPAPSPTADTSDEDTIRIPRYIDSRRSSGASTIVPDREDQATPLPGLFSSLDEKENEGQTQPVFRPADDSAADSASSPDGAGGVPMRRSKAGCALSIPGRTDVTPVPSPVAADSDRKTRRMSPNVTSGPSSGVSRVLASGHASQAPLPSLLVSMANKENGTKSSSDSSRGLPKSLSAPQITFTNPFADDMDSDGSKIAEASSGPSRRLTKALPPSRIPILRSKSLSAKPSTTKFTFTAPPATSTVKDSPVRRAVSLNAKRVDPRAILTDSLRRNGTSSPRQQRQQQPVVPLSPAKRSVAAAGLSASPGRLPSSLTSPRRVSDAKKSKFRIISAPPPVTIPTRPATAPRNVSGPSPTPPRVTAVSNTFRPGTPEQRVRGTPPRNCSPARASLSPSPSPGRAKAASKKVPSGPARAPQDSALLTGKRVRDRRDEGEPLSSPSRARVCPAPGGFPMKRA